MKMERGGGWGQREDGVNTNTNVTNKRQEESAYQKMKPARNLDAMSTSIGTYLSEVEGGDER